VSESECLPIYVLMYPGHFRVVQSGSFDAGIIKLEPQWPYKVQFSTGIRAQPYDVASVGWDFRLVKNDMQHMGVLINK
jgi:hypothetical protein